jgi:hypothetical protein
MITEEKILKNTEKYFKTAETHGFMTDTLLDLLGQEFIKAPASTRTDLNNAFEGGLIAHLLLTTKYAVKINSILPETMRVDMKSLLKVTLLHQIGKAKLYISEDKWHQDRGMMYKFNNDLTSMSVGERSTIYALSNGISLTEEEFQAIINHDKDDSDRQAKFFTSTLGVILKQANELAIMEEKTNV